MPLMTYRQTGAMARLIANVTSQRTMPPWFADPQFGRFSNDPSLTAREIEILQAWASSGAPAGNSADAPPARHWASGWKIAQPDVVFRMPKPVAIPADGDVEYTYEIVHTGFTVGKWAQKSEVRPSSPENVHHAVVYVRPPGSAWLKNAPIGVPFTASDMTDEQDRRDTHMTTADILLVYAPGSSPDNWPDGMAKFIPPGSDLVFQMHYTTHGHPKADQTSIGIVFARNKPKQRVLTLQLTNDRFVIPLFSAPPSPRQAVRLQHPASRRVDRDAFARALQFLLAIELSPGPAPPAEGRNGPASRRAIRQFEK
jgi:hypothetical protein